MSRINAFYCPDGNCWIADFADDWLAEMVHGTTQFPLPFNRDAPPNLISADLEYRYPESWVVVCYEMV